MSSGSPSAESTKRHISELPDPRQRFLARVVDHTLEDGWRSSDDFLRHFPPSAIVESLANADELRVKLLVATTGTHEKIVRKKSRASATEDLEIALSESTTTPSALVGLYPPDDKVRYLDAKKLWSFVVEDEFYKVSQAQDAARHGRAASRLTFILECALAEGLISLRDIADGMTFDEIAASLPVSDVRDLLKHALQIGRASAPLTEERFLAVVPLPTLVAQVRLDHTFDHVVIERIAVPSQLTSPPPPSTSGFDAGPMPDSVLDIPNDSQVDAAIAPEGAGIRDSVVDDGGGDDAREKVLEGLRAIDRLPPSYADLSTPVLLSIESMYADLWAVSDDDEREAAIRESFPNESLLRTAMLSMIELLDPSVDTKDPIIRDADVSGLIKIVLFEERRRREPTPSARRSSPGASQRGRRSVPPPLPRSSAPPPLPGDGRVSAPPPLPAEASGDKRGR
jgi:hypothetical protein